MAQGQEPIAHDAIRFIDSVAFYTECMFKTSEQNAMYNGYHADTMVHSIVIYGAEKMIPCTINFPCSSHDGSICSKILSIICEQIGVYNCVDQGFPWGGYAHDILVGPLSKNSARALSPILQEYLLCLSNSYVPLQQASEWGMHCL